MSRRAVVSAVVVACAAVAEAKPALVAIPPGPAPAAGWPLLVALHGDGGDPAALVEQLRPAARRLGLAVLAPPCPAERGCRGSFWRWGGSPDFLREAIADLGRRERLDPQRLVLLGWSGGASYLAAAMPDLSPIFAAVLLWGGGMPGPGGCAARPMPVAFLSGTKNPLRGLAEAARDQLRRCGHPLTWVSLPGADHAAEWQALGGTASEQRLRELLPFRSLTLP